MYWSFGITAFLRYNSYTIQFTHLKLQSNSFSQSCATLTTINFLLKYSWFKQMYSFACEYPVVPAPFVETTVLSPIELSQHPCWIPIDCKHEGLFLVSEFSSIDLYMSFLMPEPHSLGYWSFVAGIETKWCESSNFVLLCQDDFGYSGSLKFPYDF